MSDKKFGFKIARTEKGGVALFTVALPHQCDDWEITGEFDGDMVTHEQAVASLGQFIDEARVALVELQALGDQR